MPSLRMTVAVKLIFFGTPSLSSERSSCVRTIDLPAPPRFSAQTVSEVTRCTPCEFSVYRVQATSVSRMSSVISCPYRVATMVSGAMKLSKS